MSRCRRCKLSWERASDGKNVEPNVLEATMGNQLRASGFDGAAIVMLGGPDGGETDRLLVSVLYVR